METFTTNYDEIEQLEKESIFSLEKYKLMSLFDMKKIIVLENKIVYIKENQWKWEFPLEEECLHKIKDILLHHQHIYEFHYSENKEMDDQYKITFTNHSFYLNDLIKKENPSIKWNGSFGKQMENKDYILDLLIKIIDILDTSNLELDIKREFELEENEGPFIKKTVEQFLDTKNHCWIFNLDHIEYKYPWDIHYNGSLEIGWTHIINGSFYTEEQLQNFIKMSYGPKHANLFNIDSLWVILNKIKENETMYIIENQRIKYKFIIGKRKGTSIEIKKAYYIWNAPFNGNRIFKEMITCYSKNDPLLNYFDGIEEQDMLEIFPIFSTIFVGPLDRIKEKMGKKQYFYLYSDHDIHSAFSLYRDKMGNYYISNHIDTSLYQAFYNFKEMEEEKEVEIEVEDGEPICIDVDDFLTRDDLFYGHHKIKQCTIRIKVINETGAIEEVYSPALYSFDTNRYYISEQDYHRVRQYGSLLCKLVEESYWQENSKRTFRGYSEESILHIMGYKVTKKKALSDAQRKRILECVLDYNILTKDDIEKFFSFLIHSRGKSEMLSSANEKWKMDLEHIQQYEKDSHPISITNTHYLNEYIRLI